MLTDGPSFQGAPEYLDRRGRSDPHPALRKDFMIDPYQVLEARAWRADCILLIVRPDDDARMPSFDDLRREMGIDVLVGSARRSRTRAGAEADGADYRDQQPQPEDLRNQLETSRTAGAASRTRKQDDRRSSGCSTAARPVPAGAGRINTFLIGESLMRQDDVTAATRTILTKPAPARASA